MHLRNFTLLFVGLMIVATLSACGGSTSSEGGGGGQGDKGSGAGGGKEKTGKNAPETQTLEGRVARVDLEKNRFVTRPEEGEPVNLTLRPEGEAATEVSLDGEDANLEDIEQGQQATVEYRVVMNKEKDRERNVALTVQLTPAQGGGTGAEETTGG